MSSVYGTMSIDTKVFLFISKKTPYFMFLNKRNPEREKYELATCTLPPFGFQTIEKYIMKRRKNRRKKSEKREKRLYYCHCIFFLLFMFTHLFNGDNQAILPKCLICHVDSFSSQTLVLK